MDALRRAEESKQGNPRRAEPGAEQPPGLALEPLGSAPAPNHSLPDLAEHLAAVDADLQATAAEVPKPAPAPPGKTPADTAPPAFLNNDNGRNMAQAMFAAKPAAAPSRLPLWLALGLLVLFGIGIALYFWLQWRSLATPPRPLPPPAPAAMIAPAPPPLPPPVATAPRSETPSEESILAPAPPPRSEPRTVEDASPIRLTRNRPTVDPDLQRGWQSLQSNALEAARRDYEQALKKDPHNVDTLLGLAAIAQRQGRQADADRLIQQAIEADPKDAAALAAQANLAGNTDPQGSESRLKTQLAAQPDSPQLNFALGNLLANQGRWAEAQQAYFIAFSADGENPDYLFNLAVSLDHLRQNRLAIQYYRQALTAAEKRPPAFNRERALQRLGQLTGPTQP